MFKFKMVPITRFNFSLVIKPKGVGISIPFFFAFCFGDVLHEIEYYCNYRIVIRLGKMLLVLKSFLPNPICKIKDYNKVYIVSRKTIILDFWINSSGPHVVLDKFVIKIFYFGIPFQYRVDISDKINSLTVVMLPLISYKKHDSKLHDADMIAIHRQCGYDRLIKHLRNNNDIEDISLIEKTVSNVVVANQLKEKYDIED